MKFIDRQAEMRRLDTLAGRAEGGLAVVWGRAADRQDPLASGVVPQERWPVCGGGSVRAAGTEGLSGTGPECSVRHLGRSHLSRLAFPAAADCSRGRGGRMAGALGF